MEGDLIPKAGRRLRLYDMVPFNGQGDFATVQRNAFRQWVAGPGAGYELKKFVPKAK